MGGLQPERQGAVRLPVEAGAEGDEPVDQARSRLGDAQGNLRLGQAGARGERVVRVERGRIVRAHRGGDAALCPTRGGSGPEG